MPPALNLQIAKLMVGVVFVGLTGTLAVTCARLTEPEPSEELARGGARARLHLTIDGASAAYVSEDDADPWQSESWTTTANTFDLTIENRSRDDATNVQVLAAVDGSWVSRDDWEVWIGSSSISSASVFSTSPQRAGFGGGSHGVYPPSGDGAYAAHVLDEAIAGGQSVTIPVEIFAPEGFELHVDAGSDDLYNPASHDVDVRPDPRPLPGGPPPPDDDILNPGEPPPQEGEGEEEGGEEPPPDLERARG